MNAFTSYTLKPNAEMKTCTIEFFFILSRQTEYINYARFLSSIAQHNFYYTCTYTTTCIVTYSLVLLEAMKGLSSQTLQVQRCRLLWDKAQSNYKDHNLKEVTLNNIGKSVEIPGLCQIHNIIIIIRFLIKVLVQGHHPHQWAPFQVTG